MTRVCEAFLFLCKIVAGGIVILPEKYNAARCKLEYRTFMEIEKDYPFNVSLIKELTKFSERTIQNYTVKTNEIVPFFAVKYNGEWRYTKKAVQTFVLMDVGVVSGTEEVPKYKALELVYGVPVNFSLAIMKKER